MFKNKKFTRSDNERPGHCSRKRRFCGNRFTSENETTFASTSATKLKNSKDFDVTVNPEHGYRIIHFLSVFTALSGILKCKTCDGEVNFDQKGKQGLGFKLVVECRNCNAVLINSCPLIDGKSYEINRRIVFVMRLLGVGLHGLNLFCGMMDISQSFAIKTYYTAIENIYIASKTVFDIVIQKAGEEEKRKTAETNKDDNKLIVSGDGSWSKRGFSSLFGVITLIGHYSNKILDVIVKSSFCKTCQNYKNKVGMVEYEEWFEEHKENCLANHKGSAGKMEVDGMIEMFQRTQTLHNSSYGKYIGDGDTKTFKALLEIDPEIEKKECVNHVQKRIGTRLRNAKKNNKNIGGKGIGKLTDKLIKELTTYYGLAIRRHPDSADSIINEIWSTYYHKISTNENPMHSHCPPGLASWCKWRRAEAEGTLDKYNHPPPLNEKVQQIIRPIYEDLSSPNLIKRCLGGYTQNNNESFNAVVWQFAPKHIFSASKIIEIATFLATCIFNEGCSPLLKIMEVLGMKIGPQAKIFVDQRNAQRLKAAERRSLYESREARMARKNEKIAEQNLFEETEGILYGPGIAD